MVHAPCGTQLEEDLRHLVIANNNNDNLNSKTDKDVDSQISRSVAQAVLSEPVTPPEGTKVSPG
jgi:hypothetical protein